MSIQADDEFNLRLALMSELDDVAPRDELAHLVIARHRKVRRLRFAGVCILMFIAPPGYTPPNSGTTVVVKDESRDLVIGATGLSRTRLDSLVSSGLKAAA